MERYQRAMVNIMTRRDPASGISTPPSESESSPTPVASASPAQTLTCPAGTLQDPSYLTIPFTAPSSDEPITAKDPKRLKEQGAAMFIAAGVDRLVIGKRCDAEIRNISIQCFVCIVVHSPF